MARTQAERSAATQQALIEAARRLWGERGYAEVSTPEIAEAAGVTRGAMYHQYADKAALFRAVIEAMDRDIIERLQASVAAAQPKTPADTMHAMADAWLDIAVEPEVRQLMLQDAPSVIGWAEYREMSQRNAVESAEELLQAAIDAGQLRPQPLRPLALVLLGALDEAAMYLAGAEDPAQAREDVRAVVRDLIDGLLTGSRRAAGLS
ncbi:MAG TPA: helix-turn-helix domain-containing protein [Solirubrobacteraceae bacterium]|nr:helix-turn-helix domain-containing protein [Solirubrobacteraceae bacterium]